MRFCPPWPLRHRRSSTRRTGRLGEHAAVRALKRRGYRILGVNVRTPEGEIDILALEGRVLVVVEVKTRTARHARPPEPRVGRVQHRRLRRAARWLLRRTSPRLSTVRLDLVAVTITDGRAEVRVRPGAL